MDVLCNHSTITKFSQEINMNMILLLNPETLLDFTKSVFPNPESNPGSHMAFTWHVP